MIFHPQIHRTHVLHFLKFGEQEFREKSRLLKKCNVNDFALVGTGKSRILSVTDVFFLALLKSLKIRPKQADALLPSLRRVMAASARIEDIPNFGAVSFANKYWDVELHFADHMTEIRLPNDFGGYVFPFRPLLDAVVTWSRLVPVAK